MALKLDSGVQKKKNKTASALQSRLDTLRYRFENGEIDRQQYLEGLSLFVADRK
jgi:hypothetical protein